ncbi:VWA domain-containing protein [uncultured Mailhella sp.]|uniref:cobaltochelatase CobT-related protein n=1 Tax=uncultured Mailhella sp. TaxID=1981031 RepID=UPI0026124FA7|nr:VWA domain-containing protein [uncultured Mailhella sp.]
MSAAFMNAMPLVASMLGDKLGVKVVIGASDTALTDHDTIYLPPLPIEDEGELHPLVSGYIDHEAAHIRYTDQTVLEMNNLTPLEKTLWNSIEDWRVEHEIVKRYPGCREHFLWLIRHLFLKDSETEKAGENESPAFSVLNYVLLTLRSWDVPELSQSCGQEAERMERHWPGLRSRLDTVLRDIPAACRSSQDALDFARKILRHITTEAQKEQKKETDSGVSPSGNSRSTAEETSDAQSEQSEEGKLSSLGDLLQATEDDLPNLIGIQAAELLDKQCQAQEGMKMAVEGALNTSELPAARIQEVQAQSRALQTRLQGLLQAQVMRRSCPSRHGKLYGHRLYRLSIEDPRVFLKTEECAGLNTAVHILLDISGSMVERIELASAACYTVARALTAIPGISTGVTAFPANYGRNLEVSVCPLLRHGERLVNRFGLQAHGGTPLTEALWWVIRQLAVLRNSRKIILIITDGEPDHFDTASETITTAQKMGMEVMAIGINAPLIGNLVALSENILTSDELAPAMFRLLQQTLLEHRR